jgi:CobQ-like glutamine amidotransferase family enzyme
MDLYTVGAETRMIGNFAFDFEGTPVVGFENHSGRTFLGADAAPLGKVISGFGNNGADGTEGARYKNVFGTYSHGPALPKNPVFCDYILETALRRKYGEADLAPISDFSENEAHDTMLRRITEKRRQNDEKL